MKITDKMLRRAGNLIARDSGPVGLLVQSRYKVVERIAYGGMGEIFRAEDTRLGRPVAMKILSSRLSDPDWTTRFEGEARTMGQIDHPGIVPIHDLGRLPDGRLYYTMKLVDGKTLGELVEQEEDLSRLLRILARICDVVHVAHAKGVVHRDLKPSNIMIDATDRVYVLDWGIARIMAEVRVAERGGGSIKEGLTSVGTVLGTIEYMPPEQAQGRGAEIDARSDVYSLGAVLYEMLAGRAPYAGGNATELLEKIARGKVTPPRRIDPSVPADLEMVCLRALARSPRSRYPNAKEFGRDLLRWIDGDPVAAHPSSTPYRLRKRITKHRWISAAAAAAIASILALGGYWIASGEDRALLLAKEREEEIFDPIKEQIRKAPKTEAGWKEGIELLDAGLKRIPGSWQAWIIKAELHEKCRQYEEALRCLRRATEANPNLGTAHYFRGRILMDRMDRKEEALREFEEALRVQPDNEFALVGRARIAMLREEYERALELCREAEPVGKHLHDLHFIRGYIHSQAPPAVNDIEEAVRNFSKSIELEPHAPAAFMNRGTALSQKGDLDGAIADLTRAIELDPEYAAAYANRGMALGTKKEFAKAISDCNRAIELDGTSPHAFLNRGAVRDDLGEYRKALEDYDQALALDPKYSNAYFNRGNTHRHLKDFNAAIADYDRALSLNPVHSMAFNNRGMSHEDLGNLDQAVRDYTQSIKCDPLHAKAYNNRGVTLRSLGKLDRSIADCTKAIEIDPGYANAYTNRGIARQEKGDLDGSLKDHTKAIELDPTSAGAYLNRGATRKSLNDFDGAIRDYTDAILRNPRLADAYSNRGNAHRVKGQLDKAIADWSQAIEIDPRHAQAYVNRGTARAVRGDLEGAISDLSRAIEYRPGYLHAYLNRGLARRGRKDTQGARADFRKVLELAPADWPKRPGIEKLLKMLDE